MDILHLRVEQNARLFSVRSCYKTTPNTDSEFVENVFAFVKCANLLGVLSPFSGVSECAR